MTTNEKTGIKVTVIGAGTLAWKTSTHEFDNPNIRAKKTLRGALIWTRKCSAMNPDLTYRVDDASGTAVAYYVAGKRVRA